MTLTVLAAVVVGGYATAVGAAEIPGPTITLAEGAERTVDADPAPPQQLVDAQSAPSAVGWLDGETVWSNTDGAAPIASISKLATALVCLEAQPVAPGDDGPAHVWSAEDRARQDAYLARDGVAFPIPVGTEVTTRQMLMLALVPSANDFAAAYAYAVFGDNETFVAAVDDWAARNGLGSLELFEPTGMDERNVASPGDLVKLARLALAHPTISEFAAMPRAELPWGIGEVESTNPLFGMLPGIVGAKTGATDVAGYNLAAAQRTTASGRELVQISVVLGRDSDEDRASASAALLAALAAMPRPVETVTEGERIGTAATADGIEVPLLAEASAQSVLAPGEGAVRTVRFKEIAAGASGRTAGTILIDAPAGSAEVAILTGSAISDPGYWWRLTHPALVFGWG